MPLTPDQATPSTAYCQFGARVAGILDGFLREPPHKRTPLTYARLLDRLTDAADESGVDLAG